jgi:Concanavalin A-like lectin/glucanases superfamily
MTKAMRWSLLIAVCVISVAAPDSGVHPVAANYLEFPAGAYVEIPAAPDLSVTPSGFTISAWIKPRTLEFTRSEGSGYVYWMGKGDKGRYEWAARMYSHTNRENPPRPNRISFYVFNAEGGLGQGSYSEEPVKPGEWIQITASANGTETAIYRNGEYVRCDEYDGPAGHGCHAHPERIQATAGDAPLRLGSRDLNSFFEGGLSQVRIWNRALRSGEAQKVFHGEIPRSGLVAEFLLDEGKGNVVHDTAGGHQGKIVGARWAANQ